MCESESNAPPGPPRARPRPEVGAILLNWKDEAATWRQVERLQAWRNPPAIWVVENEPLQHANPTLAASIHRIAPGRNLGYAGGVNAAWRAMAAVRPTFVLLLNTDIELHEVVIEKLREQFTDPSLGVAGPLLEEPSPQGPRLYAGGRDPVRWVYSRRPYRRTPAGGIRQTVDYVPGTICLIRGALMEQLNGLAESYFFSGEIADFCLRARAAGYACAVQTDLTVPHHTETAGADRDTLYLYYSLRNRFLLARRNRPVTWPFWWAVWTARGIAMAALRARRGSPDAARSALAALRDAWRGRFGLASRAVPSL